jgi:hypothetical protein
MKERGGVGMRWLAEGLLIEPMKESRDIFFIRFGGVGYP